MAHLKGIYHGPLKSIQTVLSPNLWKTANSYFIIET